MGVVFFNSLDESFGKKAYNLAFLFKNGYKVPPGFVIPYTMLEKLNLSEVEEEIYDAYLSLSIDLDNINVNALLNDDESYVAVRGEKGKTILNVKGKDTLFNVLKDFKGQNVIIQKMIFSDKSGVCYIENNKIIVKACFGLGESLSTGTLYPDVYVLDKDTLEIKAIDIADKKYAFFLEDGKTKKQDLMEKSHKQVLIEKEIFEIAKTLKRINALFGSSKEVDWAIHKDNLYIIDATDKNIEIKEKEKIEMIVEEEEPIPKIIDVKPKENEELDESMILNELYIKELDENENDEKKGNNEFNQIHEIKEMIDENKEQESDFLIPVNESEQNKQQNIIQSPKLEKLKQIVDLNIYNLLNSIYNYEYEKLKTSLKKYTDDVPEDFEKIFEKLTYYEEVDKNLLKLKELKNNFLEKGITTKEIKDYITIINYIINF